MTGMVLTFIVCLLSSPCEPGPNGGMQVVHVPWMGAPQTCALFGQAVIAQWIAENGNRHRALKYRCHADEVGT